MERPTFTVPKLPPAASFAARRAAPRRFPGHVLEASRARGLRYDELEAAEDSHYSCLMPDHVAQVAAAYEAELGAGWAPRHIIDATANVGCDALNFRRMYPGAAVTAIELDPATAAALARNAAALGGGRLAAVCGDAAAYLAADPPPQADLVYYDPPWGGPGYQAAGPLRLALGGQPLGDVVGRALRGVAGLAVVKAPATADLDDLYAAVRRHGGADFAVRDVRKARRNARGAVAFRLVFARRRD